MSGRALVGLIIGAAGLYSIVYVSLVLGIVLMVVGVLVARWGDMESPFRPR